MAYQLRRAAGYLAILIAPALLALSAWTDEPFLVVGVVMLVFPLARVAFGVVDPSGPAGWDSRVAAALDWLPRVYVAVLVVAVAMLLMRLSRSEVSVAAAIGWSLSLWLTMLFATCVAHELLHRPERTDRTVGHLLAGLTGYPILGYEHSRHHRLPGNTAAGEWPRIDDTVWRFAVRRLSAILAETVGARGLAIAGRSGSPVVRGLRIAMATTCATLAVFGATAGWAGMAIYAAVIGLVGVGIQLVTYMQHWGLGDDSIEDAKVREGSWDSDCRFEAWVTMGLSLHQVHHRDGSRTCYRIGLAADSPRLPSGYVLLMFAALVPPVWKRVMLPALAYWRAQPSAPLSAGRRIACVALYK